MEPSTTTTSAPIPPESDGTIVRITQGMGGEAGGQSGGSVISGDGDHVAFHSTAWDLVPGDTNAVADVFVWDATTGSTTRITDGNNDSFSPAISADGRFITFYSSASTLVTGDLNGNEDVFVWDATTGATTRITDGDRDSNTPVISADGRYIAYLSFASNLLPGDTNDTSDVFVWDATSGTTTRISDGDYGNSDPAISGDGRYIAYTSLASNLVPGDTNGAADVFVWDATTGATTPITEGDSHSSFPAISADGRYVTFYSVASNLVSGDTNGAADVFVWDATTGATTRITDGNDASSSPAISADGNSITFASVASNLVPGDTNRAQDVFVWNRNI